MASCIRPRRSVWSQPQRFGTLSSHRLCTFISHTDVVVSIWFVAIAKPTSVKGLKFYFRRQSLWIKGGWWWMRRRKQVERKYFSVKLVSITNSPKSKTFAWENLYGCGGGGRWVRALMTSTVRAVFSPFFLCFYKNRARVWKSLKCCETVDVITQSHRSPTLLEPLNILRIWELKCWNLFNKSDFVHA